MWMLDNRTPYQAERTWVRDKDGVHHWIVVVKATYDIALDGSLSLSQSPVPPLYSPEFHGEPGTSSLKYDADLIAMKPSTDVYLNAVAFAPMGKPAKNILTTFRISNIEKKLLVQGPSRWRRNLLLRIVQSSPKHFQFMPIRYEHAFGGSDQTHPSYKKHRIELKNPVGTGIARKRHLLLGKPAISVRYQGFGKRRLPAGYGAVASYWKPRSAYAGTYDREWELKRKPLLPFDYDERFLLCSPRDQQLRGYLRGNEWVEMRNLTPSCKMKFRLPATQFEFETFLANTRITHKGELVTVIINSDPLQLILSWQTSLRCAQSPDYLDKTIIRETREIDA